MDIGSHGHVGLTSLNCPKNGQKRQNVDQKIFMTQTSRWTLTLCKLRESTLESLNHVELGRWDKFREGSFFGICSFLGPLVNLSTLHPHTHLLKPILKYVVTHIQILWNAKGEGLEQFGIGDNVSLPGFWVTFFRFMVFWTLDLDSWPPTKIPVPPNLNNMM